MISGNGSDGVYIGTNQGTATGNVVAGNYIGTDVNGTKALANTDDGVAIDGGTAKPSAGPPQAPST